MSCHANGPQKDPYQVSHGSCSICTSFVMESAWDSLGMSSKGVLHSFGSFQAVFGPKHTPKDQVGTILSNNVATHESLRCVSGPKIVGLSGLCRGTYLPSTFRGRPRPRTRDIELWAHPGLTCLLLLACRKWESTQAPTQLMQTKLLKQLGDRQSRLRPRREPRGEF